MAKYKLFSIIILFLFFPLEELHCQLMLGGGASINLPDKSAEDIAGIIESDNKQTVVSLSPEIAYLINPTWAVGCDLSLSYHDDPYYPSNISIGFSPFARYYKTINSDVDFFLHIYCGAIYDANSDFNNIEYGYAFVGMKPGLSIELSDNLLLDISIGNIALQDSDRFTTFGIDFNTLGLGLIYKFD